jgi:2-keto-4-pentenoate hydratase
VTEASDIHGETWDDERVRRGMAAQLARREELLAGGASRLGWKLAFGPPPAKERWGIRGPAVGFLTDATLLPAGTTRSVADLETPALEFEVAVRVGIGATGPVPAGVGLAFELADLERKSEDLAEVVAGDIFHRGVVLGELDRDPNSIGPVRVERDGEEIAATADPAAAVGGDVATLTAYVGRYLAAFGEELREGDVIITGSVVPLVPCADGGHFVIEAGGLGSLDWTLSV